MDEEPAEKRGRGQPPKIQGQQFEEMGVWTERWVEADDKTDVSEEQELKKQIGDEIILWTLRKFGILDPWRKLTETVEDPEEDAPQIKDGEGLDADFIKATKKKLREVCTLNGCARSDKC